jgi:molecular chaperone GrpE
MPETNDHGEHITEHNSEKSEVGVDENGVNQQTQAVEGQIPLDASEESQESQESNDGQPQEHDPASDADAHEANNDEPSVLQAQLAEKEAKAKTNYDLFLRERAELENFKRRMQREKSEALRFANEPLLRDLLPVVDNLERATIHAQGGGNEQPLLEGVTLVLRSFLDVLEKHGVTRMTAKGEPFDPSKHDAVAQVESSEVAANTVLDEHASGYSLHDRLLRAAMVSVSKAPAGASQAENAEIAETDEAIQDKKSED